MLNLLLILLAALIAALVIFAPVRVLNFLTPTGSYKPIANIAYGTDPRQKLDIYVPLNTLTDPVPVVVFFYGGSWNEGARKDYMFVGEALASRGVLTVIADYRLYPQVRYPDFLTDCASALAWAHRNIAAYGGDSSRLFVMGHSAGAYNAAMLALDPRWLEAQGISPDILKGWIGLAGPYDFLPIENPDAKPVFNHPHYPEGSQPIDYASHASPPVFLGAAITDHLVNPERNTHQMAAKLRAAGGAVDIKIYSRVKHATLIGTFSWPLSWLAPVADDVADFVLAKNSPAFIPKGSSLQRVQPIKS
jgi:acetyl esterase/lipase